MPKRPARVEPVQAAAEETSEDELRPTSQLIIEESSSEEGSDEEDGAVAGLAGAPLSRVGGVSCCSLSLCCFSRGTAQMAS